MSAPMQVSRTPRSVFDLSVMLRGVGEALKHGIAWGWSVAAPLGSMEICGWFRGVDLVCAQ